MGKLNINTQQLARIRSYALRGNDEAAIASAILDGIKGVSFTVGAEGATAADTIRVSIQVVDLDSAAIAGVRDVLVTSVPIAGAGTMTVGVNGVAKAGSGSTQAWFQTDANGRLDIDVLNIVAEDNLLNLQLDDGTNEQIVLTFA